ncbi:MAG: hypothetical protein M3Z95_00390 [Actinomycetota bacterium]|nr:hypothetical protein [Actinomycetota bacterium]
MEAHECDPAAGFRVTFPGPFQHHDVVVDGWSVPFIKARLSGEEKVRLILDDRLVVDLSTADAERLIPFLADAIAIALGYGAHPREDMRFLPSRSPHAAPRRVVHIEALPEDAA